MGWDTVGIELLKRFEDGEEIKVVVQEILGKEYILEVRADQGPVVGKDGDFWPALLDFSKKSTVQ